MTGIAMTHRGSKATVDIVQYDPDIFGERPARLIQTADSAARAVGLIGRKGYQ
jgi:hypothetical protein